ncbi:MAG: hypothetical protein U0271_01070 [Polyangiaceae bacterium]
MTAFACRGPAFQVGSVEKATSCTPDEDIIVAPECGVFVAPGATDGDGSQEAPLGSIQSAIDSGAPVVYVCIDADETPFHESLRIPPGVTLYGGLDCSDWRWSLDARSRVEAASGPAALILEPGSGAHMEGFELVGPHPQGPSESSIGIIAEGAVASFSRVDIQVFDGTPGADGASGDDGMPGAAGADGSDTHGGAGGVACNAKGGDGGLGGPSGAPSTSGAPPGLGGAAGDVGDCTTLRDGHNNLQTAADGSPPDSAGTLSKDGFQPPSAGKGATGGSGGGGAGGSGVTAQGGGGGGSGGCGGEGGEAGGSGGSSIGIVWLLGSNLAFEQCSVKVGAGANGGSGAAGGAGATGGAGGNGFGTGCRGGAGGKGASGGKGANGVGGHSILIAYQGAVEPSRQGLAGKDPTDAGAPGGIAEPVYRFEP